MQQANPRNIRILLVEDNPGDVYLFKDAISKINPYATVTILTDGEQAIEFIKNPDNCCATIDLIVLDVNLPKISGLNVLKEIKLTSTIENTCIAIYSTSDDPKMKRDLYRAGAYYFINKEMDLSDFFSQVSSLYATCVASKS